ncbi:MAG: ATP-binding cassette domain-containing protein, partial [Thermoanaerobacterales bacterium]|nr:ATP-binding cassette domain-containing protein [Thermoanaerobacterales bacterium]
MKTNEPALNQQSAEVLIVPEIFMENITKNFGRLTALDKVSFNLKPGEIRALVGENGAGKSTLMNILYGVYSADSGKITLDGIQAPDKWNPNIAITNGIGMIHQHFSLIYSHTVLENIVMPTLRWTDFKPQWKKFEYVIGDLMKKYHFDVDLNARIENISIGERQQVEILKALYQGARILILDEPTAVLTPQQAESLLNFLVDLRGKGYSVVLVTHKLQEAMAISNKITVLRGGKHIATVETKDTSIREIAKMMVDRELSTPLHAGKVKKFYKQVIQLKNVTVENKDKKIVVDDVSFDIGEGEIVGIAGVA